MVFDGRTHPEAGGFRVAAFSDVSSTNAVALEAAANGDEGNLWIVARRQTAGRGRRARAWVSEPGNLYASLLLIDPATPERLAQLPIVAALALAHAVDHMCSAYHLAQLKWPNDLLIGGRKISGILIEASTGPDGRRAVVCGFGLNLAHHPDLPGYPTADLAGLGYPVQPEAAYRALNQAMATQLDRWRREPFSAVLDDWRGRATGIGRPIRVRLADRELEGVFVGLDDEGRLLLRGEDGANRVISAGDVFFPHVESETGRSGGQTGVSL
ncbi:biotin--[acetyl-CoA-carboxylase] ligase [Stappia taiwanensis]|uniref:biotin--[biotin carboxyl-carrier protein] ligase n=1 Tax=Stappia taiwanensis TaxID=992267 RepID=A0A838Y2M1_9HYPH|nr:biotin--[acetyl-CoA-carboxylase] ligase [Stappia taiwanensis]MBA4613243.1 biotin--[acetyl-CoA-carboxylase] ligase [Stappia taiwanensis]